MQQLFVDALLADPELNQRKAGIAAGYKEKSVDSIVSKLLKKKQVRYAIQEVMKARAKRTAISHDATLQRLDSLSKSSLKNVATWEEGGSNFTVKSSDELTDEEAYQIESLEIQSRLNGSIVKTKIKMRKPDTALELLGRHQGMFETDGNKDVSEDLADALAELDKEQKPDPKQGASAGINTPDGVKP